jgi:hypothetical protein
MLLCHLLSTIVFFTVATAGATPPEYAEELGGYYELRQWTCRVEKDRLRQEVRHRLTILNPRGDDLSYLSFYTNRFHKLKKVEIAVYDAAGAKVYTRKVKDLYKVCGFGASFVLYQDVCQYVTAANAPGYPYTIDYKYEWESRTLFQWPAADFQQDVPVLEAVYELDCPADLVFHHKAYGLDIEPAVETRGSRATWRWEARDLAPRCPTGEHYLTPQDQDFARIVFAPESFALDEYKCPGWSWDDIAAWYRALAADRYLPSSEDAGPRVSAQEWRARARTEYERVIQKNRYVAVSIDLGGWQPHPAEFTERQAYGDCKDLSTLLISYLRLQGITAHPVLVRVHSTGLKDKDFPETAFNHLIAMTLYEDDTVWMDPTCELCPFGDLPPMDEDIPVLLITDDGGDIVRTPASRPEENRLCRITRLHLSADAAASFDSKWLMSGNSATATVGYLLQADAEERRNYVAASFGQAARKWEVPRCELLREDVTDGGRQLQVTGHSAGPLLQLDGAYILHPLCFSQALPQESLDLSRRQLALDLGWPREIVDTVIVTWDRLLKRDTLRLPSADSAACALSSCRLSCLDFGDSLMVVMSTRIEAYSLPVAEFESFKSYRSERNRIAQAHCRFYRR